MRFRQLARAHEAAEGTRPSGTPLKAGDAVKFELAFASPVRVASAEGGATPTLVLSNGASATYDAASSGGAALVFTYAVAAGQDTADLAVTGFALNGATIRDAAGNDADLSGAVADPGGTLAVDTAAPGAPVVLGLGARPGATGFVVRGTAEAGSTVEVFDGAVSLGAVTAGSDRGWALALPSGLGTGAHALGAAATDAAGNASAPSAALPVTVRDERPGSGEPVTARPDGGARGAEVARTGGGDVIVGFASGVEVLRGADELRFIDGRFVFDPDDAASTVARLYRAGFGREVDQGGLDHWTKAVESGARLGDVAQGFLSSPEGQSLYGAASSDAEFVARLYRNVLGREGDAEGQGFWAGRLREGASRADVLAAVSESAENRAATAAASPGGLWDLDEGAAQAARMYDAVLGRPPDAVGLAFWTDALNGGGTTLRDMAEGFMASPEFQAVYGALSDADFVRALYRNTLDRPGEDSGVYFWAARLDAGLSRAAMVVSFSESPEHAALTAADVTGSAPGQFGIRLA